MHDIDNKNICVWKHDHDCIPGPGTTAYVMISVDKGATRLVLDVMNAEDLARAILRSCGDEQEIGREVDRQIAEDRAVLAAIESGDPPSSD